jgi:hypothetical protein
MFVLVMLASSMKRAWRVLSFRRYAWCSSIRHFLEHSMVYYNREVALWDLYAFMVGGLLVPRLLHQYRRHHRRPTVRRLHPSDRSTTGRHR